MQFLPFGFQLLSTVLVGGVCCSTVLGSSVAFVNATAVSTNCSQSTGSVASCNVSAPSGVNGPTTASGAATSTFDTPGGRMELSLSAFGPSGTASGGVSYSVPVMVIGTGTTGSLAISTNGFAQTIQSSGGTVSSPFLGMLADGRFFSTSIPNSPSQIVVGTSVDLNTVFTVTLYFDAQVTGSMFHDGTYALADFDEILTSQPIFTAFDASGPAIVEFVPEPQTACLTIAAGLLLLFARKRSRRISA